MAQVKATLLLVGEGPLKSNLAQLARDVGVSDRVHLLGEFDEPLASYFLAADIFVLPSIARSEAFGIVQLEAMAAGVPVVNTFLDSGVPHVSLDGKTGLTVPPGDVAALAKALQTLLADAPLRARLGTEGRARVLREFSGEAMIRKMVGLYERVRASRS